MHNKNFFYLLVIPSLIIICIQLCLAGDSTRDMFTNIEAVEGISYSYEMQSRDVFVELELTYGNPDYNIIVLYNAREVARFTENKLVIPVDCDGVLQIQNNTMDFLEINVKSEKAGSVTVKTHDIPVGITTFCFVEV